MNDFSSTALPYVDAANIRAQISPERARHLVEEVLTSGFDPATDPERSLVELTQGHLLLMPTELGSSVGIKLAAVSPQNPERGLPRIQALYVVLDASTLRPKAVLDGSVLTALRTPAVTAAICNRVASPQASRLVVYGSGPQAIEHTVAMESIRNFDDIRLIGRTPERTQQAIMELDGRGVAAVAGSADDLPSADIVVCATSSADPLFEDRLISDGTCVAAIGSHQPDRRELPGSLLARACVIVEDVSTAMREAGDIVQAVAEGHIDPADLVDTRFAFKNSWKVEVGRPTVFKGTGMAWQDLAVANALDLTV